MMLHVTIRGGRELTAKLGRLSDEMAGKALEDAVTAGALLVENAAKENLVKNRSYITGNLLRSIHTEATERSRSRAIVVVGTDVEYARRVEYGFSGADSLGRRYNQPAKPYLRPALDTQKGAVTREVREALRDLLRHVR